MKTKKRSIGRTMVSLLAGGLLALSTMGASCTEPPADGVAFEPCSDVVVAASCKLDAKYAGTYEGVDTLVEDFLTANNVPGCAYGVTHGSSILYLGARGTADFGDIADPDDNQPWRLDTMSPIASVSKTITAVAILRMIEDQQLGSGVGFGTWLGTRLADLLPEVPASLENLTLLQLLSHSAGLPRTPSFLDDYQDEASLRDLYPENEHPGMHPRITWWGHKTATSQQATPPGVGQNFYSNTGFRMLASIVDLWSTQPSTHLDDTVCSNGEFNPAAQGSWPVDTQLLWSASEAAQYYCGGYEPYVRHIFETTAPPEHKMSTMCLQAPWRAPSTLARPYTWVGGGGQDPYVASSWMESNIWQRVGSSGWQMTIGDLSRMLLSIDQQSVINAASLAEMQDPANAAIVNLSTPATPSLVNYTLGTWLDSQVLLSSDPTAEPVIEHGGNLDDYSSWYRLLRPAGGPSIGVALLCNGPLGTTARRTLTRDIIDRVDQDFFLNGEARMLHDTDPALACSAEATEVGSAGGDLEAVPPISL